MSWDFNAYLKPWKEEKFVQNLDEKVYHAEPAVSSGQLRTIMDERDGGIHKLHAEKTFNIEKKETPALRFGSLFHKAALEGPDFLKRFRIMPEFTGKTKDGRDSAQSAEAKTKRQQWLLDLPPGAILVEDAAEMSQISGMMNAMLAHPKAKELLNGGIRELSGFFNIEGMRCRIRIDLFQNTVAAVVDLKTARNAYSTEFWRQLEHEFYFMQAWFYLLGATKLLKAKGLRFKFIVVEKEPPYLVSVHEVGESHLSVGDTMVQYALSKLRTAIQTNNWLPEPQEEFMTLASDYLINKAAMMEIK